ncbi:MAG: siderophore-interacting protein [Ilumatobacteraceae bacterium]
MTSETSSIDRVLATKAHNDGLFFTTVDVVRVERPTPRLARITFTGDGLRRFHLPCANVAVRLFFPADGERLDVLEPQSDIPPVAMRLRTRTRTRVYTVRRFDADALELDLDFVLHGDGLAGGWAEQAEPGWRLLLSGPRGHAVPPADATHVLAAADETALPALATVLAALPGGVTGTAFVSVADLAERQQLVAPPGMDVQWVDRSAGAALAGAIGTWWSAAPDRGERPVAWLAGELFETRAVREWLLDVAGYPKEAIQSFPYWRRGSDGTTLDEARAAAVVAAVEQQQDPTNVDDLDLVD